MLLATPTAFCLLPTAVVGGVEQVPRVRCGMPGWPPVPLYLRPDAWHLTPALSELPPPQAAKHCRGYPYWKEVRSRF